MVGGGDACKWRVGQMSKVAAVCLGVWVDGNCGGGDLGKKEEKL